MLIVHLVFLRLEKPVERQAFFYFREEILSNTMFYFSDEIFRQASYKDLYFGNILREIDSEVYDDPSFKCPRIKNHVEDIESVSTEIEVFAIQNPIKPPPDEIKEKISQIYDTAKRLGVYPD